VLSVWHHYVGTRELLLLYEYLLLSASNSSLVAYMELDSQQHGYEAAFFCLILPESIGITSGRWPHRAVTASFARLLYLPSCLYHNLSS
jgi:hypothetical protein